MGAVQSIGYRNVKGNYFLALQEREAASWAGRVASMFTTDQEVELYKWLANVSGPRKWTGERTRQQLSDFGLQVIGDKYENTLEVDIDDLRRDKINGIMPKVGDLARKVATLPQRLLSTLINNGGSTTAFDGGNFFSTSRVVKSSGTINNDITVSGTTTPDAPTTAAFAGAILTAVQGMYGFNDDSGDPINDDARKFVVMVPTKYWQVAQSAVLLPYTSTGVSNLIPASDLQISVVVNPRMTGTAAAAGRRFVIFREDASVRALIWQDEDIGAEAFKTLGPESETGFWRDSIAFGAKRICACAPGLPQLAMRVNLAA
jgi:phage major head subunit gpT-like protein